MAERLPSGETVFASLEPMLPALSHPLRHRAYLEAVKEPVSAKDLAERLDVPLPRMSYHVRLLAEAGLLEVVSRTPRRGAVETHYRAVATMEVSDAAFERSTPEALRVLAESQIALVTEDLRHAIAADAHRDDDFFLSRAHFVVDAEGRERLAAELRAIYERLAVLESELRAPPGPDTHEINVLLGEYAGARAGGRNGPVVHNWHGEMETIPDA